jgi:hypothetical protein
MTIEEKAGIVKDFLLFCKDFLQIETLPKVKLLTNHDWVLQHRSFGMYDPRINTLLVYIGNRNLADILRTTSHELVHHKQNEDNRLQPGSGADGSDIENEANTLSGIIMRKYGQKNSLIYESSLKSLLEMGKSTRFNIFCDMDGVLCDFEAQFDHYYGTTPREYAAAKGPEILKNAIDDIGVKYWSEMPWFPGAQKLWQYIGDYSPSILSSPSKFKYAEQGKLMWIKNNLSPQPKDIIFEQTGQKHIVLKDYEPRNSILIDDYYRNTIPWKEAGGVGIRHTDADKTISILQKFGL